jgi:hypothetical protein
MTPRSYSLTTLIAVLANARITKRKNPKVIRELRKLAMMALLWAIQLASDSGPILPPRRSLDGQPLLAGTN